MEQILLGLGESDCEAIGDGLLAQPVNALSSLLFSVVGLVLVAWAMRATAWERRFRLVVAGGLVLTGIGSFLYHGPQWAGSGFAHDITFLATLVVIGVTHLVMATGREEHVAWWVSAVVVALFSVAVALAPEVTNLLTASAVVLIVVSDVAMHRVGHLDGRWYAVAIASLAVALVFFAIGRTDSPLCDPSAWLQAHGLWHAASAIAIGAYVVAWAPTRARALVQR